MGEGGGGYSPEFFVAGRLRLDSPNCDPFSDQTVDFAVHIFRPASLQNSIICFCKIHTGSIQTKMFKIYMYTLFQAISRGVKVRASDNSSYLLLSCWKTRVTDVSLGFLICFNLFYTIWNSEKITWKN